VILSNRTFRSCWNW